MNLPGIALRVATPRDAPLIQALLDDDPATYALLEGAPPRRDEAQLLLAERPPGVGPRGKRVYVADATCVLDLIEGFPQPTTWYLGLVFVARAARGQGLGSRLLAATLDLVTARGGEALRLAVGRDNPAARRLYARLGFTHVRYVTKPLWAGGTQEVEILDRVLTEG